MLKKIGLILIVLSFAMYGLILAVPLLSFSVGVKVGITSGLVIAAEVAFWVGALILGKEVVAKYRQWFNPKHWFTRETK